MIIGCTTKRGIYWYKAMKGSMMRKGPLRHIRRANRRCTAPLAVILSLDVHSRLETPLGLPHSQTIFISPGAAPPPMPPPHRAACQCRGRLCSFLPFIVLRNKINEGAFPLFLPVHEILGLESAGLLFRAPFIQRKEPPVIQRFLIAYSPVRNAVSDSNQAVKVVPEEKARLKSRIKIRE